MMLAVLLLAGGMFVDQQVLAQSLTSGDIIGTVSDPTGAVLPGAEIQATTTATGSQQTATANNSGAFRFAFLPPARYSIAVSAAGFQQSTQYVDVGVGQSATVNLQLAVASSSTTVNVSEAAAAVQTENG